MPETISPHTDTPLAETHRGPAIGERNGRHRLTAAMVREARALYSAEPEPTKARPTFAALARKYGVSRFVIRSAVLGLTWKGVDA